MLFSIKSSQRNPRSLVFRLVVASLPGSLSRSVTGCPEGYAQCTVQRISAGSFRLDYAKPFKRVPVVNITPLHATLSLKAVTTTRTATSLTFLVKNDSGTATDPTEIDISVDGFDTADQLGA